MSIAALALSIQLPALAATFANPQPIDIRPDAPSSTASTIPVAGLSGRLTRVTVTLTGLTHSFPADLDIVLLGPQGHTVVLLSDVGGGASVVGVAVALDDTAETSVPTPIVTGTFRPTGTLRGGPTDSLPVALVPAHCGVVPSLALLNGTDPNGTWTLVVVDDTAGDGGEIHGGWTLQIETAPVTPLRAISCPKPPEPARIVVGAGPGSTPEVRIFRMDSFGLTQELSFLAYDVRFGGGVRVATCDLNSDGVPDIVTAPGPGGGPHIRAFDGRTGMPIPGPLGSFFAYDPRFIGGVFVACADVNGDGMPDIMTGAGPGGGPHVKAFSGVDGREILGFFGFDPGFAGGAAVGGGF